MDEQWMRIALDEARAATQHGDVPVGAVAVQGGTLVARDHNRREAGQDPTAHAELLVLREAARALGTWRLDDVTLYVTLEPCAMCAGAVVNARIEHLIFGADDPKAGGVGAVFDIPREPRLNHQVQVTRGILAQECAAALQSFFHTQRAD